MPCHNLPTIALAAAVTALSTDAAAQSATISPHPASAGSPISFSYKFNFFGCYPRHPRLEVHDGSPTGPLVTVLPDPIASATFMCFGPGDTLDVVWDQTDRRGRPVAEGDYWLRVPLRGAIPPGSASEHWTCITIDNGGRPALTTAAPPRVGQANPIDLTATPSAFYLIAASLDSNQPVAFAGVQLCLSLDPLLLATVPPRGAIQNASGLVPPSGEVAAGLALPLDPFLVGRSLVLQSIVHDGDRITPSNGLPLLIGA
ncbi:MAG: hypothetical protein AAF628_20045 [Planctomycetota bacterium]